MWLEVQTLSGRETLATTMTKFVIIFPLLLLISCNHEQNGANETIVSSHIERDTLSREEYEFDISSKQFVVKLENQNKNRPRNFYSGDTVRVSIKFESKNVLLAKNHSTEIRPLSDNISFEKTQPNEFRLIIDSENVDRTFTFQPYIKSNRIIFEDSYYDTLGSSLGPKYNSIVSSYVKTYYIEE